MENLIYSGTSDKGLSLLRTKYPKKLYIKDKISCPKLYFLTSEKGNLPIKDKMRWSQDVLYLEVSLYT